MELPQFSHENHRKRFYRFTLSVPRLSGTEDLLPVIAAEQVLNSMDLSGGSMLRVEGQIRSHNIRQDGVRRLLIFVFATAVIAEEGEPVNDVTLQGNLCRIPTYRHTPLGRQICDVMLCVPRAFHRADYIPCILWGRIAQEVAPCRVGELLHIHGRLQSRVYTKLTDSGKELRTAYEVSALFAQVPESEDV
jgi:single-stranded DNA-binding protein